MFSKINHANIRVYCLVQSNFFAHHHFHKSKIKALSSVGIDACILSIVPKNLYKKRREDYDLIAAQGDVKLIIVPHKLVANFYLLNFLLKTVIENKKILIHILRSWTLPVVIFKILPLASKRLVYVQEFEGDNFSELMYVNDHSDPSRVSSKSSSIIYRLRLLRIQFIEKIKVKRADGLVLVSNEHCKLWSRRLGHEISASILPTLSDPESIRFDNLKRVEVREQLNLMDKTVVAYVGNVVCMWQRRDEMCKLISSLCERDNQFHFLAIVRRDDFALMKESILKFGIEQYTTLLTVDNSEIYKYLSAADIGLFLRHNHTMNKIVTSGKLIEYLTAGLPLITTGHNAEVLNEFIVENRAGFFIDESLEISESLMEYLRAISLNKHDTSSRKIIRKNMEEKFYGEANSYDQYARFIKKLLIG